MQDEFIHRSLPVKLTQEEVKERGAQHADALIAYEKVEEEKKAAAADYASQLKTLRSNMKRFAEAVKTHEESRAVKCLWQPNFPKKKMELVRQDTGEVVERRDMAESERQESLLDMGLKLAKEELEAPPPKNSDDPFDNDQNQEIAKPKLVKGKKKQLADLI